MFLDDRVLVELGTVQGSARIPHKGTGTDHDGRWMRSPTDHSTDQDDVLSGALFLILQLADVKVRIVRRLEHVRALLLLVVVSRAGLEVRGGDRVCVATPDIA